MIRPVRYSSLKHFAKSAAHYEYFTRHPRDTPSLKRGRAIHSYLLGSEGAVVVSEMKRDMRTAAYRDFAERHAGKEILSPSEFYDVKEMRRTLNAHPEAMRLLSEGEREQTLEWEWNGVVCGGTPDVVSSRGITELKSGRSAHPDRFLWDARSLGYHGQLAWYRRGLLELGKLQGDEHHIVCVENAAPYVVTVFRVTPSSIESGEKACRLWLEKLLVCEATGRFPGYCESVVDLEFGDAAIVGEEEDDLGDDE